MIRGDAVHCVHDALYDLVDLKAKPASRYSGQQDEALLMAPEPHAAG